MVELKEQVENSIRDLDVILRKIALASNAQIMLPNDCYELWSKRAKLLDSLQSSIELFPIRDEAWAIIKSTIDDDNIIDRVNNKINFCGQSISFTAARYLALSSYMTTTWAIYDRMANVCGRLIGNENIGNNPLPQSNPKLCEHFISNNKDKDKNKLHGFSLRIVLPSAYAWPIKVSYIVRNWLVHEGLEANGIPLFRGNEINNSFFVNDDARKYIDSQCSNENISYSNSCCSSTSGFPWYDLNLLTILSAYHSEVDMMLSGLLKWSVDSFVGQVEVFAERDAIALRSAAVLNTI